MNNKLQHVVLAALAAVSVAAAFKYFSPRAGERARVAPRAKDSEYVRSIENRDGSTQVRTAGAPLRYSNNNQQFDEATALMEQNDFAGAEKTYRAIFAKTPDELAAGQGLATALFHQGRYEDSKEIFQSVLKQDPRFYYARAGLGAVARVQSLYPEAIQQYSLAISENPTFALSYFGRGVSFLYAGKQIEAEADLNKTLELLPATADLAIEARAYIDRIKARN